MLLHYTSKARDKPNTFRGSMTIRYSYYKTQCYYSYNSLNIHWGILFDFAVIVWQILFRERFCPTVI